MSKSLRSYIVIILAVIFWALSFVWFKIANEAYRPLTIVYLRLIISVIVLSLFLAVTGGYEKIGKKDFKYFFLMSFCEPFLYFIGESIGLTYVSSTTASVLIATIPVFTAIGAWILFKERLKRINYIGILISLIGVVVFVMKKDGSLSFNYKGLMLIMLAVLSAIGYTLILKRLAGTYNPIYIVNVQNIIGVILFLPLMLSVEAGHIKEFTFNSKAFIAIIELAVFASCGAFILFGFAVRKMGVTRANAFSNLIPVFTAIFAFLLIGDSINARQVIGMAVVITGLFLSQSPKKWTKPDGTILAGKTA